MPSCSMDLTEIPIPPGFVVTLCCALPVLCKVFAINSLYSFEGNPLFHGPVPQDSMLQEQMLKFRKQVELAFAQESNPLTSVMKRKKVPVRETKRVEKWFILRDAFRLVERMIQHVRATVLPQIHVANIKKLEEIQAEQMSLPWAG